VADGSWTATERLDSFDCTLANLSEMVLACLQAAGAGSVAEIGAEHGLFTKELLTLGPAAGVDRVVAMDPAPRRRLRALAEAHPELELVVATSHDALPSLPLPDAVIIDGDHNYFTVSEELRLIAERAPGQDLPLLLLHDVGWPLGRRDSYHDPERVPAEHRQPIANGAFLVPGEPAVAAQGLYYECVAEREGGANNGVLTALEDFLAGHDDLRMAFIAPFFGLAVVWHRDAPWAASVESAVAPWDRNPLLERLEDKRVEHLVSEFQNLQRIDDLRSVEYDLRFEAIGKLLPIFDSSAFAIAERLSRLRQGGSPNFSREQLGAVIDLLAGDDVDTEQMRGGDKPRERAEPQRFSPAPGPAGADLASEPGT
jgi:hypothetical protein